jgi:hypothetical protein
MQRTYEESDNENNSKMKKYEKIAETIEDILFSEENTDIQKNKECTVEISRIFYEKSEIDDIKNNNMKIKTSNIKSSHFKKYSDKDILSYGEFRLQSLNGINRLQPINKIDDSNDYEYVYEERGFAIYYDSEFWLVTIKIKCGQNNIPMIVDYDQSYDFYQRKYSDGLREIGILDTKVKDVINYDICDTLSQKNIFEIDRETLINKFIQIVKKIDVKYNIILK